MRVKINDKKNFINMFNQLFINNKIDRINSISIDSRIIERDDIYIPIKGKKYDGHNFIQNALDSGALLCFSENNVKDKRIINTSSNLQIINSLASGWKKITNSKIIGITGSNGKTTTKELLYKILTSKYNCSKNIGNYNSLLGLPLSFLNSSIDDDYCILEYGANKPNEIDVLCKIVQPDYSLITNISDAHIGNYKNLNELIQTKFAIYNNLQRSGVAFINSKVKKMESIKNSCKIVEFNTNDKLAYDIPNHLKHLKNIISSCYVIAEYFKIDFNSINNNIKTFNLPNGRGKIIYKKGLEFIDDSYNANPSSVILGINRLNNWDNKGKKIFIFGDMLELGESEVHEHKLIAKKIDDSKINILLTFGNLSKITSSNIKNSKITTNHYNNYNSLINYINQNFNSKDTIYIKGSRSMHLNKIIENL